MAWNNDDANGFAGLSKRERECLHGVALLKSSKQIAQDLGISRHTVDKHLKNAIVALNAVSRFDAANIFKAAEAEASRLSGRALDADPEGSGTTLPPESLPRGRKGTNAGTFRQKTGPKGTNDWYYQSQTLVADDNQRSAPGRNDDGAKGDAAAEAPKRGPAKSQARLESVPVETPAANVSIRRSLNRGGDHELTFFQKLVIVLASALCLLILISTSLASLTALTELCRTTSFCDGPRIINH